MNVLEVINNELERLAEEVSAVTGADHYDQIVAHRTMLYNMLKEASVSCVFVPDPSGTVKVTYGTN